MEVAGATAEVATKTAVTHLERELGYLVHLKRNVNNLKIKVQQLSAAANDLRSLIEVALNNNEHIREVVEAWLTRADTVLGEARQLIDEAAHINSWFRGWWCCSRFSLGRKADKESTVIEGLLADRSAIGDTVSIHRPVQSLKLVLRGESNALSARESTAKQGIQSLSERSTIGEIVSTSKPLQSYDLVSDGDFNTFSSRESTSKQVIKALSDGKISLVGVFGMAGVGKTMLVQAIANQVKEVKLFQEVVIVTISQNHRLERIQGDIANGLDLHLGDGDTVSTKAARLSQRLNQGKTVLIVLDDVWERLDLARAGIKLKRKDNRCKIIFTTRDRTLCNQMETDEDIEVGVLLEDDSWALFRQKAGNVVDKVVSPTISRGIVNECKGLPLAIVTLGLTLRNTDNEIIWKDALTQLKKSIFEGMTPVFSSIKLSYDFLPNETVKLCFLFCCLFPEDDKIDTEVLLRYLIGENLIKNVDSLEESRGRLQALVGKLTDSNLLLNKSGYIMMHDVIRDVAISIASEDCRLGFIVKAGWGLNSWPNLELIKCKRLSLMKNDIRRSLPHQIKAPHLVTLSMRNNVYLRAVPDDFFSEMGSLLTLDLSNTGIKSLPSSLSCLSSLRTLLVERCQSLTCMFPAEKMKTLEILSFRASSVQTNIEDVEDWSSLKLLDLSDCKWAVSPNVIASMLSLEELYMPQSRVVYDYEGVLSAIESLPQLRALELHRPIPPHYLSKDLPTWENLTRFKLFSSGDMDDTFSVTDRFQRNIRLIISPNMVVANWVKVLVAQTEVLALYFCEGIESLMELDGTGLNGLKKLSIDDSYIIKSLINTVDGRTPKFVFSCLEELHMRRMSRFKSFCIGMLPAGFLWKLRVLTMSECKGVTSLMHVDLSMWLQNLEYLEIHALARLENLIDFEKREDQTPANIMPSNSSYDEISNCPPSLPFANLRSLDIVECLILEYVFSIRVAQGLARLTMLKVSHCESMKTIFAYGASEDMSYAEENQLILPSLKVLEISELPQLSTLTPSDVVIYCPSLDMLRVQECKNLKRLPFGSDSVPKLQKIHVDPNWFNELKWKEEGAESRLRRILSSMPTYERMNSPIPSRQKSW